MSAGADQSQNRVLTRSIFGLHTFKTWSCATMMARLIARRAICWARPHVQLPSRPLSTSGSGIDPANPDPDKLKRMQWAVEESDLGRRFPWLVRLLTLSPRSTRMRNSAKLYMLARSQAARPEFQRYLGNCWWEKLAFEGIFIYNVVSIRGQKRLQQPFCPRVPARLDDTR